MTMLAAVPVRSLARPGVPRPQASLRRSVQPAVRPPAPRQLRSNSAQPQKARKVAASSGGSGGNGGSGSGGPAPAAVQQLVASPLYRIWLQLGVVLLLLMLIDAGFSGDWSRIGVLTTEQEAQLRQAAAAVGVFHLACGAASAAISSGRGEAAAPRVAKVLAVGFLALVEVWLVPEQREEA